jgi:hypothetical protein
MLMFILGFCTMSVFTLLALYALDTGKKNLLMVLAGPAMWLWIMVAKTGYTIYKTIALAIFRNNYLCYRTYVKGNLHDTYYIHKNVADFFYTKEDNHDNYYAIFIKDCKDAKSLPFKQRKVTPRGVGRHYRTTEQFLANSIRPYTEFYNRMAYGS